MITFKYLYVPPLEARFVHDVSPDYDESCLDCARLGNFSSAWTIQAAATVLKRELSCTYPPVNGILDKAHKILDTIFKPRIQLSMAGVKIMWTHTGPPNRTGIWTTLNHFVPLLPPTEPPCIILENSVSFRQLLTFSCYTSTCNNTRNVIISHS